MTNSAKADIKVLFMLTLVLASLPLGVAMARKIAPRGRSMVARLMMGFAFGLGGVMSPVIGKPADPYSVQSVLAAVSFVPLATLPLIFCFPGVQNDS